MSKNILYEFLKSRLYKFYLLIVVSLAIVTWLTKDSLFVLYPSVVGFVTIPTFCIITYKFVSPIYSPIYCIRFRSPSETLCIEQKLILSISGVLFLSLLIIYQLLCVLISCSLSLVDSARIFVSEAIAIVLVVEFFFLLHDVLSRFTVSFIIVTMLISFEYASLTGLIRIPFEFSLNIVDTAIYSIIERQLYMDWTSSILGLVKIILILFLRMLLSSGMKRDRIY